MKKKLQPETSEEHFKSVLLRLDKRFKTWYHIIWYGMLQGAGAVLGAALLILILAIILEFLGLTELSEAIKQYGRYGTMQI